MSDSPPPPDSEWIQEPKKTKANVGDKAWGPYKTHEGADITSKFAGGPWGLGDPEDTTLRKVEKEILIPNMIKKKAKIDYCKEFHERFFKCAEQYGLWRMTYKCREESTQLRTCVTSLRVWGDLPMESSTSQMLLECNSGHFNKPEYAMTCIKTITTEYEVELAILHCS